MQKLPRRDTSCCSPRDREVSALVVEEEKLPSRQHSIYLEPMPPNVDRAPRVHRLNFSVKLFPSVVVFSFVELSTLLWSESHFVLELHWCAAAWSCAA